MGNWVKVFLIKPFIAFFNYSNIPHSCAINKDDIKQTLEIFCFMLLLFFCFFFLVIIIVVYFFIRVYH